MFYDLSLIILYLVISDDDHDCCYVIMNRWRELLMKMEEHLASGIPLLMPVLFFALIYFFFPSSILVIISFDNFGNFNFNLVSSKKWIFNALIIWIYYKKHINYMYRLIVW